MLLGPVGKQGKGGEGVCVLVWFANERCACGFGAVTCNVGLERVYGVSLFCAHGSPTGPRLPRERGRRIYLAIIISSFLPRPGSVAKLLVAVLAARSSVTPIFRANDSPPGSTCSASFWGVFVSFREAVDVNAQRSVRTISVLYVVAPLHKTKESPVVTEHCCPS